MVVGGAAVATADAPVLDVVHADPLEPQILRRPHGQIELAPRHVWAPVVDDYPHRAPTVAHDQPRPQWELLVRRRVAVGVVRLTTRCRLSLKVETVPGSENLLGLGLVSTEPHKGTSQNYCPEDLREPSQHASPLRLRQLYVYL